MQIPINARKSYSVFQVRGDENASQLFEFLVGDNKFEYAQAQMGREGDGELNFITTSHEVGQEQGMPGLINGQLNNGYSFRKLIHNHPTGKAYPSTPTNSVAEKNGDDLSNAQSITTLWRSKGKKEPQFFIYVTNPKRYVRYDQNGLVK